MFRIQRPIIKEFDSLKIATSQLYLVLAAIGGNQVKACGCN